MLLKEILKFYKEKSFENNHSPVQENLKIYIIDNGQTLNKKEIENQWVSVIYNKNTGGAGGFTRGILEVLHNKQKECFTHILLMDDDAVIEPDSLVRTFGLLSYVKDKYKDAFVGGAILRLDYPYIQHASGEIWDGKNLKNIKVNYDLTDIKWVLQNEQDGDYNYNGWWYCGIPLTVINEKSLPLPLFIHGDDIEYGHRLCKKFILLNGICVWHEPFEYRQASSLAYYNLRNLLIITAIRYPQMKKSEIKKIVLRNVAGTLFRYRYKDVPLIVRAVEDFCKGIDWLKKIDAVKLHSEITQMGYSMKKIDELVCIDELESNLKENPKEIESIMNDARSTRKNILTFNGCFFPSKSKKTVPIRMCESRNAFYRVKKVLFYDPDSRKGILLKRSYNEMFKSFWETWKLFKLLDKKYEDAKSSYCTRVAEITGEEFWGGYLR